MRAGLATEDEMSEEVPRPLDEAAQIVLKGNVVSL
jgi:hypothetical protein